MAKYEYLLNEEFLQQVDESILSELQCRIIVLNNEENIIDTIEGRTSSGSISLSGTSAIRRTGSLTLVADSHNYHITDVRNLISINRRVEIEIGITNTTNLYEAYPILWFPLGQYAIGSASINQAAQGLNISISLKDKMSLLNGDLMGTLGNAITHSPLYLETKDEYGNYIQQPAFFRDIIYTLLIEYGKIPKHKIIIEDIPFRIKNLVRWVGNNPVYIKSTSDTLDLELTNPNDSDYKSYGFNTDIGYMYVDFTYPGELTSNAGESIYSVLEKIKKALGNYEFFFDVDGVFHFQAIKDYLDEGSVEVDLTDAINDKYLKFNTAVKSSYTFKDNAIVTAMSNNPQYGQIKNNFIVWGQLPETKIPIRYRLAIDEKPVCQTWTITGAKDEFDVWRVTSATPNANGTYTAQDWRTELYLRYIANPSQVEYYSKELKEEWPKIYDLENQEFKAETPAYYFDMVDPREVANSQVANLAIGKIGNREKAINDTKVNCLVNPIAAETIKNNVFIETGTDGAAQDRIACLRASDKFYQIDSNISRNVGIGTSYNPAFDLLRSVLHESIGYNEQISISMTPVYHLEPNTRITVENPDADISGDYIITTISIPLTLNGSMSISAKRAVERI